MNDATPPKFQVGLLLFPQLMQLDLVGPWEVFSSVPQAATHLIWKTREPVSAAKGMQTLPDTTFADCPPLDLLCIPGGPGVAALLDDDETLDFIRAQARQARYLTSVCTGSLVLGAAGLLGGRRAACHWLSMELLSAFGATPVHQRVVVDGNLVTGGGVTAGIDFALEVVALVWGRAAAEQVQLGLEYAPQPPFDAGSPRSADPQLVAAVRAMAAPMQAQRRLLVDRAAARLALAASN
jgi:cyclohexyl-isocyanide hydratase